MLTVNKENPNTEENLFSSLMFRFLPFWPVFLVLLVISVLVSWGFLRYYAVPAYEITAALLIKDERKGVTDPRMMEAIDAFTTSKLVENEINIISSRALMSQVVDTLMLYSPTFEEGRFKDMSAYASSPVKIKLQNPEKLKENPKIYFGFDEAKSKIIIDNTAYPLNKWVKTPYGTMCFIPNKEQSSTPDNPLYFSLIKPRKVTDGLIANLLIEPSSKLSTILNITLEDPVPQRGEDILNHLIYTYKQVDVNDKKQLAANTLTFIENRIKMVQSDLEDVENKVQKYKSEKGVVDLNEQGKQFLQNVGDNDRRISDINLKLAVLQKIEKYVISKNNRAGIVPSTLGLTEPVLSQLLDKLSESETQYQKLSQTTAEKNPILIGIAEEIEKTRPSILENIRNQRENLEASKANLVSSNGLYNAALQTIPQKEKELVEISRQQAIKNSAYSFLLQKREETALSNAPTNGNSQVIDVAESTLLPVSPNTITVYLIAVLGSLVCGIALITSKEVLTSKLLFRSDIEERTAVPIVIELSNVDRKKETSFTEPTEIFVIEQFRQMRATMGLFGRSFNRKKIMVTSSIAGEGKSYVSNNLAYSLAASGKRVILLDFDFRSPNTSQLFGCYKQEGIIDYLSNEIDPKDLVQETAYQNLSILPAGAQVGDHTELLLNGKLENLFTYLENEFDYIIIDTPPIELVSDAYLLAEYCDATLFIMRHGVTPKNKIARLNQNLKLRSASNLSIVFTGVKKRGFIKGDHGYGYGYEARYGEKAYQNRALKTQVGNA